ncbi:MAG: hypothetical protein U9P37_02760, partial [Pseudomonadota bacterium]|nr:hypothetical protein [Pseudomonadota bacterium]
GFAQSDRTCLPTGRQIKPIMWDTILTLMANCNPLFLEISSWFVACPDGVPITNSANLFLREPLARIIL